jgi:hypothetical protein
MASAINPDKVAQVEDCRADASESFRFRQSMEAARSDAQLLIAPCRLGVSIRGRQVPWAFMRGDKPRPEFRTSSIRVTALVGWE